MAAFAGTDKFNINMNTNMSVVCVSVSENGKKIVNVNANM